VPVQDGLSGLAGVSLTCSAQGRPSTAGRTSNDKKSNPDTKPPPAWTRGKLIGFKLPGYSHQPYRLAVVTRVWQVRKYWRGTDYTRTCDGQWITQRISLIILKSSPSPAKYLPSTSSITSVYLFPSIRLILRYPPEEALLPLPVVSVHLEL
jgi:hypothetical protein